MSARVPNLALVPTRPASCPDFSDEMPLVVNAEAANGDGADRSVDRCWIKAGENFGKRLLRFEVLVTEDEPTGLIGIKRVQYSVVADSDRFVC